MKQASVRAGKSGALLRVLLSSRRFRLVSVVLGALLLSSPSIDRVLAAAGELDPGFGNGGKTVTSFSTRSDFAYAEAIQSDNKIVVVGTVDDSGPNGGFAVARYTADGHLDSSFGNGGKVTTKLTNGFDTAHSVAIQTDGKIVVAGDFNISGFALVRYNANGTLDSSFGVGGKVLTSSSSSGSAAYGIAIQADGKLIASGSADLDFALVRYKTDGNLDLLFGKNGRVTTSFTNAYSVGWSVAIQSDGKIVGAGYTYNGNANQDFAVARYNTDGSLDSSFGNGGKVITTLTNSDDNAYSVAIQTDGKIVVGGGIYGIFAIALARYNPDGSLDSSFGVGGKVITKSSDRGFYAFAITLQTNGKILAAGYAIDSQLGADFAVVRYNVDGSLDSSFGIGGIVITDFGSSADIAWDVAVQSDGKIVVIGYTYDDNSLYDFAIARYSGDGVRFDLCIQDDSTGTILRINFTTGDYEFTNCSSFTLDGTGVLTKRGSTITLQQYFGDRRLLVRIDGGVNKATAYIQAQGMTFSITDRNISDDSCACTAH